MKLTRCEGKNSIFKRLNQNLLLNTFKNLVVFNLIFITSSIKPENIFSLQSIKIMPRIAQIASAGFSEPQGPRTPRLLVFGPSQNLFQSKPFQSANTLENSKPALLTLVMRVTYIYIYGNLKHNYGHRRQPSVAIKVFHVQFNVFP